MKYFSQILLPDSAIVGKAKKGKGIYSLDFEITARCNNNCRHCTINLPANDLNAKKKEISLDLVKKIIDDAASLGALWCLLTGGEPLLRDDFVEIYRYLKKKGFLVSVFTNATLINKEHIDLFKKYPPRDIEVTVYGVTKKTYERITRKPGSFDAFMQGLELLLKNKINVRFKTMVLRSNVHELSKIAEFCQARTCDFFRFDPNLHLRYDGNPERNKEIKSERLSAKEIVSIEKNDPKRFNAFEKCCDELILSNSRHDEGSYLFNCGVGFGDYSVSFDGFFRLCASLWHTDCIYDLKKGDLVEAHTKFAPGIRDMSSSSKAFLNKCKKCSLINFCLWCPAHAHLETGKLDRPISYFCKVTKARIKSFRDQLAACGASH